MEENNLELQFNYSVEDSSSPLELSFVDGDEVSTVKLPENAYPDGVWETCVFYADGLSHVLKQYSSAEEAREGHRQYVDSMIAAKLLNSESMQ